MIYFFHIFGFLDGKRIDHLDIDLQSRLKTMKIYVYMYMCMYMCIHAYVCVHSNHKFQPRTWFRMVVSVATLLTGVSFP